MFAELFPIIQQTQSILLRVQQDKQDPTKLQVFITPQHQNGEKYPALNQTIMLSNSPELLDQEFCAVYSAYAPQYVAASTGINDSLAQLAANTEAAKKAVTKHSTKADSAKASTSTPKPVQKPTPEPAPQVSLFADLDKIEPEEPDPDGTDADGDAAHAGVDIHVLSGPPDSQTDLMKSAAEPAQVESSQQVALIPSTPPSHPEPVTSTAPAALFQTI